MRPNGSGVLVATKHGPMIVPPHDTYNSLSLIRYGEYSPAEFATWRPYLAPDAIVVDAGANIGGHTLAFANACPDGKVFAAEPQRMLAYMLAGSVALNGLTNVEVRNVALGDSAGSLRVPQLDYGATNNFGAYPVGHPELLTVPRLDAPDDLEIPVERLDSWDLSALSFLKIDVEHMELAVLRGAAETIQRFRPVIAVEADNGAEGLAVLEWLQRAGYRAWWHAPLYGALWPDQVSHNLMALPVESHLPDPIGDVGLLSPWHLSTEIDTKILQHTT